MTVSGSARFFTRLADGQYSLVEERPFALYMKPNETTALDGHLDSRDQAAARLEIDWQANVGTKGDSAASVQHILRTTACP